MKVPRNALSPKILVPLFVPSVGKLRRLTVSLDDQLYVKLVECSAQRSKMMSRFSLSESIRDVIGTHLESCSRKKLEVLAVERD